MKRKFSDYVKLLHEDGLLPANLNRKSLLCFEVEHPQGGRLLCIIEPYRAQEYALGWLELNRLPGRAKISEASRKSRKTFRAQAKSILDTYQPANRRRVYQGLSRRNRWKVAREIATSQIRASLFEIAPAVFRSALIELADEALYNLAAAEFKEQLPSKKLPKFRGRIQGSASKRASKRMIKVRPGRKAKPKNAKPNRSRTVDHIERSVRQIWASDPNAEITYSQLQRPYGHSRSTVYRVLKDAGYAGLQAFIDDLKKNPHRRFKK